ncbi:DUF2316 family protein [Gordonia sp. (in: high G+C Gram-positive bacteria)]|uniref:DUF2316 family protein n=1 Tax=Gordonia sp. (in: high G+C Gram-positive bacteria) TaxID=84139 RepID=UPI0039E3CE77
MSLDAEETRRTGDELRANMALSTLNVTQVADDLDWDVGRVADTLAMSGGQDPADVWELRDYLVQAIRDRGEKPVPFTVLTDQGRLQADRWFGLRQAPSHDWDQHRE